MLRDKRIVIPVTDEEKDLIYRAASTAAFVQDLHPDRRVAPFIRAVLRMSLMENDGSVSNWGCIQVWDD